MNIERVKAFFLGFWNVHGARSDKKKQNVRSINHGGTVFTWITLETRCLVRCTYAGSVTRLHTLAQTNKQIGRRFPPCVKRLPDGSVGGGQRG